jgi:osmotically-inducible protein OsmY
MSRAARLRGEAGAQPMQKTEWRMAVGLAVLIGLPVMGLPGCATYAKCGFAGCPGDAKITAEVQSLFDEHADMGPPNLIRIQTWDRVVYLSGLVSTDLQRSIAGSIAGEAPGAVRVVNSLSVADVGF